MDWLKIVIAILLIMMIFRMWPAFKHYTQNAPKAEKGDWQSALIPLGAVALLVILLILAV